MALGKPEWLPERMKESCEILPREKGEGKVYLHSWTPYPAKALSSSIPNGDSSCSLWSW